MHKRNVLLMYISEVSGHHQATKALENALRILEPKVNILNINAFNYTNPISEKIINRLYTGVIKRTPKIWDLLYDNPRLVKGTRGIKDIIHRFNSAKLKVLFDKFQPNVIACTQAYPCGMVADLKKTYNLAIPLVGILTDFIPHSYWLYDSVDQYIVASSEAREELLKKGVPSERIKILGIPIDHKFSHNSMKNRIAQKLGLDLSKFIILIMGGGQGLGPIKKIVRSLEQLKYDVQLVIVTGINKQLYKYLTKKFSTYKKKMVVLGYVDNIDELMEVSSFIITKPGGLTIAEALSKGLPIISVNSIPGQEENNIRYLLNKGVAIKIEDTSNIKSVVENLLHQPHKLNEMSICAKMISKPSSALDIADLILKLCSIIPFTKSVNILPYTSHLK